MLRATGGVDWRRDWTLPRGLRLAAEHRRGARRLPGQPGRGRAGRPVQPPDARRDASSCAGPSSSAAPRPTRSSSRSCSWLWSDSLGDTDVPNEDSHAAGVFLHQPVLAEPLPRPRPARDRAQRQHRRAVRPLRPGRLEPGADLRPGAARDRPRPVPRRHRARRPLVRLRRRGDARLRLGSRRRQPHARRQRPRVQPQRVLDGLRRRRPAASARATSTSPRTTPTPPSATSPRPANSRSARATGCMPNWEVRGTWRFDAVSGANLRAGGGPHLWQRMRGNRPFGLAPVYVIG